MRFSLRNTHGATATADDWTCIYGGHLIAPGERYISVTVDDCGALFFACMQHAPSEDAIVQALRSAGIPVEG